MQTHNCALEWIMEYFCVVCWVHLLLLLSPNHTVRLCRYGRGEKTVFESAILHGKCSVSALFLKWRIFSKFRGTKWMLKLMLIFYLSISNPLKNRSIRGPGHTKAMQENPNTQQEIIFLILLTSSAGVIELNLRRFNTSFTYQ